MAVLAHEHEAQAQHDFALAVGRDGPAANLVADRTSATSRTRIGTPSWAVTTMCPIWSTSLVRPRPCTSNISPARLMLPPPTLRLFCSSGLDDLVERQAVLDQPVGIDADLILLLVAAPTVDLGRAGHGAQRRLDDPVVDRAQLGRIGPLPGDDVMKHLAQAGRHRAPSWAGRLPCGISTVASRSPINCRAK